MLRLLYSFLLYLFLPFIFLRLWWRSFRLPGSGNRVSERLGFYPFKLRDCIWIHAVSVGETMAALPLIKALKNRYQQCPILVTTMTLTGAERVQKALGNEVTHAYIPYDLPDAIKRFLRSAKPLIAIIMETELWPNLMAITHAKGIPICLMNARLSAQSARGYRRIQPLTRQMLSAIEVIAAQGQSDAKRFIELGANQNQVTMTGSIKFDLELPDDVVKKAEILRQQLGGEERFIWVAASTHEGEEEIILAAHHQLRIKNPTSLLILVPRHPDRFDPVFKLSSKQFVVVRRSSNEPCDKQTGVYRINMGEQKSKQANSTKTLSKMAQGGDNFKFLNDYMKDNIGQREGKNSSCGCKIF